MSIHEFHASLSNENATELESLRALRDAENVLSAGADPNAEWDPWG